MSNILIEANNISKIYDPDILLKRGQNFYALNQVSFALNEGDFVSIMGPSGSGKSTLLNCISTLDDISTGTLKILGEHVSTLNDEQLSTFRYDYLGFIFQNHNLISTLSIYDNIATPIILGQKSPEEINTKIHEIAKRLNIEHILNKKPNECSGGEKQRTAIARALVNNPKIIVCDEPTGNLDSTNSHEVLTLLSELNQEGISIILVTHDNMIASYAKTLFYLRDGQVQSVLHRNGAKQTDFFNEIVKVTTEDSLLKFFKTNLTETKEDTPVSTINKEVIDNTDKPRKEEVYAFFDSPKPVDSFANKYRPLQITKEKLSYDTIFHQHVDIDRKDIVEIKFWAHLVFKNFGVFSQWTFFPQLDVETKERKYTFILQNRNCILPLFQLFRDASIVIKDPIGIEQIYQQKPDAMTRDKYFQYHRKELKKEFNI